MVSLKVHSWSGRGSFSREMWGEGSVRTGGRIFATYRATQRGLLLSMNDFNSRKSKCLR